MPPAGNLFVIAIMEIKIQGQQINLRKLTKSDAQSIYQNANDFDIAKYTPVPFPYKLKDAEDFIKLTHQEIKQKKSYALGIEFKEIGLIIGMVRLLNMDFNNKKAEISYWLGKNYRGKGIAKEAVQLILDFGFNKLKFVRIYGRVMHPNVYSAKLLEKSGFQYEGRMRKNRLRRGKWMDDLRYAILKEEFKKSPRA